MTTGDNLLPVALACLARNWHVIPLCWPDVHGRCACPKHHTTVKEIGKAPLLGTGYQKHLLSQEEVRRCLTQYPRANYGILLKPSSLFVLDADSLEADRELESLGVPPGPRVRRGDHTHRYFRNTAGVVGCAIHKGQSGKIDILSAGYVVGPGSLHRSGERYVEEIAFGEVELEDPPTWAVDLLRANVQVPSEAIPHDLPTVEIDTLALPRWLKALIRCGPAVDPAHYVSRSEAVFAAVTGLLRAGITNSAILASILLDSRYAISEKPREQGERWVASEIARARAKYAPSEQKADGHAKSQRVTLRHPSELVARPISWYTDAIIPAGMLAVLHARDKLGKTLLAWEVARAGLKQTSLLDTFTVSPGRVVLALLDDPHDLTVQRRDALGLKDCEDLRIVTPLDADLSDPPAFLQDFKTACEAFKPSLIVLDALYQFAPPGKDSMNDAARMRGIMQVFNELAETLPSAVLLIVHDRKDGADVAGSHVIRATAKALLHLTKPKWSNEEEEEDDGRRILTVVSKMTGEARHLLRCQGVGAWSYLGRGDSAHQARTTWAQDRVLTWLKEGEAGIVPEIAKAAKLRNADALAALTALVEEGQAESELLPRTDGKKGKGRLVYRLKPNVPDPGNISPKETNGNDRSGFQEPVPDVAQRDTPNVPPAWNQAGTIGQTQKSTIDGLFSADKTYRSQNLSLRKSGDNSLSEDDPPPFHDDAREWDEGVLE